MSFLRLPTIGQKRKRRQYDFSLISKAYEDVKTHGISVYKAARIYGIPESTLRDRTLGLQPLDDTIMPVAGPGTTITREEEKMLIEQVQYMNSIGYGYSRQEFLNLATDFAISLKRKTPADPAFTQPWFDGLKRRWPSLTLAKPQKLAVVRAKCASKPVLDKYYGELQSVMEENNLFDCPDCIYNIDETGITMEHSPAKVVCLKGHTPQSITSSRGKNLTIIACGNATGNRLPPFYVFPGKRWNPYLMKDTSPGSAGCVTESGWSNTEVFLEYMEQHFKTHVPINQHPKLVLFDGHRSHINLTLKEWGQRNNVVFFVLPPHTSHITQPLDVGCFAPLKFAYNRECQNFLRQHPGQQITRYDVAGLSSKAYNKSITADNLISSFRKTGIYPFNNTVIPEVKLAPSTIYLDNASDTEVPDKNSNSNNFLESRTIMKATTSIAKKRPSPPAVVGNLTAPSHNDILKPVILSSKKSLKFMPPLKKSTGKENKKPSQQPSQQPSTSGITTKKSDQTVDYDSDETVDGEDNEPCCVCNSHYASGLDLTYTVEIVNWGQCEQCQHWTHLKFCSRVRCLRRNSNFLCPHCDPATAV